MAITSDTDINKTITIYMIHQTVISKINILRYDETDVLSKFKKLEYNSKF